jgi:RNA polymerase sigma-70 factor (ECF subfamily)
MKDDALTQQELLEGSRSRSSSGLDVSAVHAEFADFVWSSLQRLGVRTADLDDMLQEVFVVVHRHQADFESGSPLRPWLFGICRRVAAAHRRRAHVRRERCDDALDRETVGGDGEHARSPEEAASRQEARAELEAVLDEMDLDRRAVFVMFEIDELPCEEIAEAVGIPCGTVFSRLHAARKEFEKILARRRKRALGFQPRRAGS